MKKLSYIFLMIGYVMAAHTPDDSFRNGEEHGALACTVLVKDGSENVNLNAKSELSEDEFKNFLTWRYAKNNCKVLKIEKNGDDFTVQILNEISGKVTETTLNIGIVNAIRKTFMQIF